MSEQTDAAERLALSLTQSGLQRMTARVLAMLLFVEQETVTAGELSELLDVSPGSVSTAIKSLSAVGLVERIPAPGSRREHFRFPDKGWATLMSCHNTVVQMMQAAAETGIRTAGEHSIAGRRLADMRDFYAHVMRELPAIIENWRDNRTTGAPKPPHASSGWGETPLGLVTAPDKSITPARHLDEAQVRLMGQQSPIQRVSNMARDYA